MDGAIRDLPSPRLDFDCGPTYQRTIGADLFREEHSLVSVEFVAERLHAVLEAPVGDCTVELPAEFCEVLSRLVEEGCRLGLGLVCGVLLGPDLINLRWGGRRMLGAGALLQLAILRAKLLEFRGGRLGPVAPPFEVIHDKPCLTVSADCVGAVCLGQSGRILARHTAERVVVSGVQIVRVVHH